MKKGTLLCCLFAAAILLFQGDLFSMNRNEYLAKNILKRLRKKEKRLAAEEKKKRKTINDVEEYEDIPDDWTNPNACQFSMEGNFSPLSAYSDDS